MHLSTRTDIAAPLSFVFAALSDFEGWERGALRRGADVTRTDKLRSTAPGMTWQTRFRFRGKDRDVTIKLIEYETDTRMSFRALSRMIEADGALEVVSLAPNRTRLVVHMEVRPLTLGARLVIQSAKLAKGKLQTKLNRRLAQFALELEQRYASTRQR